MEVKQRSSHSESTNNIHKILCEAENNASNRKTLDYLSGHGSRPRNVSKYKLKLLGESLLQGRFQPEQNTVWSEQKLLCKLKGLKLTPEQQSLVDSGIQMDQWTLDKS